MEFLTLALACGLQLASELPLANVEGTIRPGNEGTSGEVDIVGNIIYWVPDADDKEKVVHKAKLRMLFDQPDASKGRFFEGMTNGANFSVKVEPFGQPDLYKYTKVAKRGYKSYVEHVNYLISVDLWWLLLVADDDCVVIDKYI